MVHSSSKRVKSNKGKGKSSSTTSSSGRPAKIRKVKEVVFDPDARKEFLTGFSKRKQARKLAVRHKAIAREKEELLDSRKALRDERKERAAHNVKTAKELYGDAGSSSEAEEDGSKGSNSDSDDSDDSSHEPPAPTAAYESSELRTTVHIEPLSFSRSPSPEPLPFLPLSTSSKPSTSSGEQSHKKRIKNKPQFRPKMSREDKKERATGGKKVKKSFEKNMKGTKGKGNKGR